MVLTSTLVMAAKYLGDVGLPTCGATVRDGAIVPKWMREPTHDEQAKADAILARFKGLPPVLDEETAEGLRAEAEIDAVPDAVVDLILAAKALSPNAKTAEVRERAKADREARRVRT